MNNDLISRSALRKQFGYTDEWYKSRTVAQIIDNAPTVEQNWRFYYDHGYKQAERDLKKTNGEWITTERGYECSECGALHSDDYPFCHMCGADMRDREGG